MKRIRIAIFVVFSIIFSFVYSYASTTTETQCADALYKLGLFSGTGKDVDGTPIYSLDRIPTRQEAAVMLVRLLGKEEEAKSSEYSIPFVDVGTWAKPYVGYLYKNGLTSGTSATTFGSSEKINANQYLTFILRTLGYDDRSGDFTYNTAYKLANKIGICSGEYDSPAVFDRGNLVCVSYMALRTNLKGKDETLLEKLYTEKAVNSNNIAIVSVPKYRIEFNDLLEDINKQRIIDTARRENFEKYESYLQHKSGEVDITKEELDSLLSTANTGKSTLTYAEAVYDIDLYFNALKYGYGGYYYFGEEKFKDAENKILSEIRNAKYVSSIKLGQIMYKHLDFVVDGHFSVAGQSHILDADKAYRYFYSNVLFNKDDLGFYTLIDGEKWYYDNIDNNNVRMGAYLSSDGNLYYNLFQFCPTSLAKKIDTVNLTGENGSTCSLGIKWTLSSNYSTNAFHIPDYNYFKDNGIAYVSLRCSDIQSYNDVLEKYVQDAASLKDCKIIIYDSRSNGGGSEGPVNEWIRNLTGVRTEAKQAKSCWANYLWQNLGGIWQQEKYIENRIMQGTVVENSIPVIFLTDNNSGSGGDCERIYMHTLSNCVVIGSNTQGCILSGNVKRFKLPNSGINFSFGQGFSLIYNTDNPDGVGFEPDIWCNPSNALTSVINMLENYELAAPDSLKGLKSFVEAKTNDFGDNNIYFETITSERLIDGLGALSGNRVFNIIYKNKKVTDYTFSNSDDSIITVKKNSKGQLVVTQVGNGTSIITINIGRKTQEFKFHGGM